MRYRLKPTEFEAFEFLGKEDDASYPDWFRVILNSGDDMPLAQFDPNTKIIMLRASQGFDQVVRPGDYIVKSTNGNIWAVEPQMLIESADPLE